MIIAIFPATGEGISLFTLSVSTKYKGCPSLTTSPTLTKTSATVPSVKPSPMSANFTLNIFYPFTNYINNKTGFDK
ncbi:hypothetical protein AAK27_172 [Mycoplasma capricolum subsp. capricolum]|nr:hypothetical protein AAK27_172 [Mycoplasma capricolum subsp. capricolum]